MASYTSVSLMSTSAWDNANACPVVSPCRWNELVASNLCVIKLHDHAGSAGDGTASIISASQFPAMDVQYIWPWFPTYNSGWVAEVASTWPGNGRMSTSTLGAVMEYDVYMRPGQWELVWIATLGSAMGAVSACIGGSHVTPFSEHVFGGVNFLTAGGPDYIDGDFTMDGGLAAGSISFFYGPGADGGVVRSGRMKLRFQNVVGQSTFFENRIGFIKLRRYGG